MAEPLHRSRDDRMLAGVAAGVAETLDADPSLVRIVWALLAILTGGIAILVYIVMAIVVPDGPVEPWPANAPAPGAQAPVGSSADATAPGTPPPSAASPSSWDPAASPWQTRSESRAARRAARRARRHEAVDSGEAGLIIGAVLVVIGVLFLLRQTIPWFDFNVWWPMGIIVLGVLLLVVAVRPGRPSG
ncbi:MAG: PspC domain-containing protein [Candidatus Limnocylindrales bacterium]